MIDRILSTYNDMGKDCRPGLSICERSSSHKQVQDLGKNRKHNERLDLRNEMVA